MIERRRVGSEFSAIDTVPADAGKVRQALLTPLAFFPEAADPVSHEQPHAHGGWWDWITRHPMNLLAA